MAHQQESFNPFSSRQSLYCFLSRVAKGSTPKLRGPDSHQSHGVPTLPKPHGSSNKMPKARGPQKDTWSQKETPNGCHAWVYIPVPIFLCSPISDSSYNQLHFPEYPEFWTPLQIPIWGSPLAVPCYTLTYLSLLQGLSQAKTNHKDSGNFLAPPFSTQRNRDIWVSLLGARIKGGCKENAFPIVPSNLVPEGIRTYTGSSEISLYYHHPRQLDLQYRVDLKTNEDERESQSGDLSCPCVTKVG